MCADTFVRFSAHYQWATRFSLRRFVLDLDAALGTLYQKARNVLVCLCLCVYVCKSLFTSVCKRSESIFVCVCVHSSVPVLVSVSVQIVYVNKVVTLTFVATCR